MQKCCDMQSKLFTGFCTQTVEFDESSLHSDRYVEAEIDPVLRTCERRIQAESKR